MTDASCDEYPFASSREGGENAQVMWVPLTENAENLCFLKREPSAKQRQVQSAGDLTMPEITQGAIDGSDAFAFFIENSPWFDLDTSGTSEEWIPFGYETLEYPTIREDGTEGPLGDRPGPEGALLIPGVSILEFSPITIDEAIGLSLIVHKENPGPAQLESHLLFSEVSVEFLDGTQPNLMAPMGMQAGLDEQLNEWRLPSCGIWRIRGYGDYDFQAAGGVPGFHPDSIPVMDYPSSGRSPESLPCQIHLEFWPEPTLRNAQHKTRHTNGDIISVPATDYKIGGTLEEAEKRNQHYRQITPPNRQPQK